MGTVQHQNKTDFNLRMGERALQIFRLNCAGDSANAVPLTKKLRTRVIYIWDDRRGQPAPSAMDRPRPRSTPLKIRVSPVPGKYAYTRSQMQPKTKTHFIFLRCHQAQNPITYLRLDSEINSKMPPSSWPHKRRPISSCKILRQNLQTVKLSAKFQGGQKHKKFCETVLLSCKQNLIGHGT